MDVNEFYKKYGFFPGPDDLEKIGKSEPAYKDLKDAILDYVDDGKFNKSNKKKTRLKSKSRKKGGG